jgi:6-phosphogluconate dehydrogenase (decarboxylating)
MQLGLIGLGRMGGNMSRRWIAAGHSVVGYARHADVVQGLLESGAISAGAGSIRDLVGQLATPRIVWLMVPAAAVDETIEELAPLLQAGDVIVDGGNSYYRDDLRRSRALAATSGQGFVLARPLSPTDMSKLIGASAAGGPGAFAVATKRVRTRPRA